jgi:hypothetical protein
MDARRRGKRQEMKDGGGGGSGSGRHTYPAQAVGYIKVSGALL